MSAAQHTPGQLGILRHALGLKDDGSGRSYRNHFVTGPGSDDYSDCEALVSTGSMTKHLGSQLTGGDPFYRVTVAGEAIAKIKSPRCPTCNGVGMVGGHRGQTPENYDESGEPCPDCSKGGAA